MPPRLPRRQIPIWVNWRRRRLLGSFREGLAEYHESLEYEAFPFRARETERARELRAGLALELDRVVSVVKLSGGPSLHRQAPGEEEGTVVRVNVLEVVFELDRYTVPAEEALAILDRARRAYEEDRRRAWLRTLNPLYWLDRLMDTVESLPFELLRAVGVSPGRVARSAPGRVLRVGLRLGVLAVVAGGLLWIVGWHDDLAALVGRGVRRIREVVPPG